MNSHTKGQWTLDTQDGSIRANGRPIAQVFGATVHNNEADAVESFSNARLIVNAPEMHEAMTNLLDEMLILIDGPKDDALSRAVSNASKVLECIDGTEAAHDN